MDKARGHVFTGSAFAADQDVQVGRGDLLDGFPQAKHLSRLADQMRHRVIALEFGTELGDLVAQAA
ncbi:MAG TPA: hypothetical protein VI584_04200, partial [Nitrospiria bacterium]|nr:hypothetical protein [Nitrospiria bacterium]